MLPVLCKEQSFRFILYCVYSIYHIIWQISESDICSEDVLQVRCRDLSVHLSGHSISTSIHNINSVYIYQTMEIFPMGVFLWEIFQCMYCRRHLHCRDKLVWTLKVIFITVLLGRVSEDWRNVLNDKCVNAVGLESQRKKFSAQLELLQRKGVALFVDGIWCGGPQRKKFWVVIDLSMRKR